MGESVDRRAVTCGDAWLAGATVAVICAFALPSAAAIVENPAGDTPLPVIDQGVVARGSIEPGDADGFTLDLAENDFVTVTVAEVTRGGFADPLLAVFAPGAATPTAIDDDDGPGFLASLRVRVGAGQAGTWRIVVSGFGDSDFDGAGHAEDFDYRLIVSNPLPQTEAQDPTNDAVPEPLTGGSFDQIAPGGVALVKGSLGADTGGGGDVDRYAVPVSPGHKLSVLVYDEGEGAFNDPFVRLLDSNGDEVGVADDDDGPGFLAATVSNATPATPQDWTVEVARFRDASGDATFDYYLVVSQTGRLCDTNGDEFVDNTDVEAVTLARGQAATGPADPRDLNGDGIISVSDARACVFECDEPDCAPAPACGLLGIEVLIALAPWMLRAQRRSARRT